MQNKDINRTINSGGYGISCFEEPFLCTLQLEIKIKDRISKMSFNADM
jgi:hypothetical protein